MLASKLFTGRETTMLEVIRDVIEHSPSDGKFLRLGEESAGVSVWLLARMINTQLVEGNRSYFGDSKPTVLKSSAGPACA
jgi:hypothetical protein